MEEEKAAAYYDELTRKGEGAARFKQGLGFSSTSDIAHSSFAKGSSSTSFLSTFVKASSPSKASQIEKQAQLETIQNKLKKKPDVDRHSRVSETSNRDRDRDRDSRRRSRSKERHRDRDRERERDRDTHRDRDRERERDRDTHRDRDRDRDRERRRRRSRSRSPREKRRRGEDVEKKRNGGVDYSRLIEGYDKMTPAERVKAKMKHQLAETAEKDATKGMGSGWERFDFNKDAPLDDEEIEAAEDDVALVKNIGQSFRFSAVEARREEQIKAAHDEAMFGVSSVPPSTSTESEPEVEDNKKESSESGPVTSLLSEKVLAKQQGSWRDRARKIIG